VTPSLGEREVYTPEDSGMVISASRTKDGAGLTLRTANETENGEDEYEATIHPGESALGYTYEEWEAAIGPQRECRIEVAEDGALRPGPDRFDAPADGHA
jgi:hypothetical protein